MPDLTTYGAFLGAVLAYQLSGIGPDMMLVISRGVGDGQRAALAAALGCVAAGLIQLPLLALGLASIVTSSPALYRTIQFIGAAYLIYLGIIFFMRSKSGGTAVPKASISPTGAFAQGMICNLTNPTALAFMLAVLPQFVHASSGSPAMQFLVLGATMKATGLVILGAVALTFGTVGGWLARSPSFLAWQQRVASVIMIGIGVTLALAAAGPTPRR